MTDLEIMQRAKMYMDKLAQGIDPITGNEMPTDSLLNNVRLARCFFYVSGVLQQVIDNGGSVGSKSKNSFVLTPAIRARLAPSDHPVRISEFTEMLAAASDDPNAKRPGTTTITDWLLSNGLMEKILNAEGKQQRVPNEAGKRIGIYTDTIQGQYGEYLAVYYSAEAQQFLLDHLEDIFRPKE